MFIVAYWCRADVTPPWLRYLRKLILRPYQISCYCLSINEKTRSSFRRAGFLGSIFLTLKP
jgi:hypothetical protein